MQTEIETRFLEIDKPALIQKLHDLRARDHGEILLKEIIFYDPELRWIEEGKLVRLRQHGDRETRLTYKHHTAETIEGTREAEFTVTDPEQARHFVEGIGLTAYRQQEKLRHTFTKDGVTVDIDTWPRVPPYVELEGESEAAIKKLAAKLELDWNDAIFEAPRVVLEKYYGIPLGTLRSFVFEN